jgi:predicted nucleic acid-binding protein
VIVLDTSAAVEFLTSSKHGEWVAERLVGDATVHAPHLLDVEVLGVLRRLVREGRIRPSRAQTALSDYLDLDLTRYSHVPLLARMWGLRENARASDAAFIALAEALGASLVTTDRRLARVPGTRARMVTP